MDYFETLVTHSLSRLTFVLVIIRAGIFGIVTHNIKANASVSLQCVQSPGT